MSRIFRPPFLLSAAFAALGCSLNTVEAQTTILVAGGFEDAEVSQAAVIATGAIVGSPLTSNSAKVGTLLAGTYRSSVAGTVNYVNISPVFVFMLPVLAEGEFLSAADLRFNMAKSGTPTYNADIYGLGFRPSGTVRQTDYFIGTLDTTDATLIQDDFGNPTIGSATARTTDDVGDTALLSYLNAQYTAGAVGGDYVFLRLSPDYTDFPANPPVASVGYTVTAANNASAATVPQLTLTVIPEPGSCLLLVGAAGLLGARRRR